MAMQSALTKDSFHCLLLAILCSVHEYNMADLELDQVTKVIGYHPRFLDHFLRTQNFIMKGDGPLPYDYRYYLAIIRKDKQ
ncbi:hypothetical protein GQX74_005251 [Glossina fuscipes]|nr:hypothetical protein GQX74_005251 [Glossina fuscipes]